MLAMLLVLFASKNKIVKNCLGKVSTRLSMFKNNHITPFYSGMASNTNLINANLTSSSSKTLKENSE